MTNTFVGGRNAVLECLRNERLAAKVLRVADNASGASLEAVVDEASNRNVPVEVVAASELDEHAPDSNHQGALLEIETVHPYTLEDLLEDAPETEGEHRRLLVVDQVQDPVNLGKLARSALFFGYDGLVKTSDRTAPLNSTVVETSAGAAARLPVAQVKNLRRALETLKDERFWLIGTVPDADTDLEDVPTDRDLAVMVGHEGSGLRRLTREEADYLVTIPGSGDFESLNVATAGAIAAYALEPDPPRDEDPGE